MKPWDRYAAKGKTYNSHRTSYFKDFFDGARTQVDRSRTWQEGL
jgi:hypothetical protein